MKIRQLSVFLENKPGEIAGPCRVLADNDINILTLCLADTSEFGILRMIIPEHRRACEVLQANGYPINECDVLAVEVPDRPGGLAGILEAAAKESLNLDYMYAFPSRNGDRALLVFRFENPDRAISALQKNGINVVAPVDIR